MPSGDNPATTVQRPRHRWAGATLPGVILAGAAGIFIGVTGWTFRYAEGHSYLSNDPKACVNCHIMRDQFEGWSKAPHHAVATCNDCHVPKNFFGKYYTKMEHGYRHSKGFTFQDFHEPIQIKASSRRIVQHNCVRCHESLVSQIEHGRATGEAADCIACHRSVAHGPTR